MKISLLICLASIGAVTAQSCHAAPAKAPAISQIVVTRFTGTDAEHPKTEPISRIWLTRDGSAVYVGSNTYMKRTGRYQGMVDKNDFQRLANLFQQIGFPNGPSSYNKYTGPDFKGRTVAGVKYDITYGNSKKTISVCAYSGPKFIRQAGHIQYGLLWKIHWQKVSSSDAITTPTPVKIKTPGQAVNIARLHYINGHRGIRYSGKPNSILNWKNPKVTRARSRQDNPLWRVHFKVPSGAALPTDDFTIVVAENGKVHHIIQAYD